MCPGCRGPNESWCLALLNADDLFIIITSPHVLLGPLLCGAIDCPKSFSSHPGLHVNIDKWASLHKGARST